MIIDSHCHASSRWYEPLDTLLFQMDRCGVERAVLIQLLGAVDSGDMLAARRAHGDRFACVAALAPDEPDPAARLAAMVDDGIAGLRLRPGTRSPGEDPLLVWRLAERAGLTISCVGTAADFARAEFAALAAALPGLRIVLEHLGGLARPDVGDRVQALPGILSLAALPNLSIKLPGLGQLAPRRARLDEGGNCPLELEGVAALLDAVIAAFGPERLAWGSDFPPVAAREGYGHALGWTRDLLAHHGDIAVHAMFGGAARALFWRGFPG